MEDVCNVLLVVILNVVNMINVKIVNKSHNPNPTYAHKGDACVDLRADISDKVKEITTGEKWFYDEKSNSIVILSGGRCAIPTGIHVSFPENYMLQILSRSGLAIKNGVFVTGGIIDSNYTGEIRVILNNSSENSIKINNGDKIAQAALIPIEHINFESVDTLEETDRNDNGFGSSGK